MAKLNGKLKDNLYTEIGILRGLHHPHIVAMIDVRESATHIHLVMEYCELGDLSYFIKKRDKLGDNPALRDMVRRYPNPAVGGLNEVVVRHLQKQLTSAVEFLRKGDFIHRDIKPQNLLILPPPEYLATHKNLPLIMTASQEPIVPRVGLYSLPMLKIADFGFARVLPKTALAETLCGSPLYMAPEILRYEKYDAKADLWSVGTVLYEMICGRPPFRASNHVELLRKIEQGEDHIKFPSQVVISPEVKHLIKCLLKRNPTERMPFDDLFRHPVVVDEIPNLVGHDRPRAVKASRSEESAPLARQTSVSRREGAATERDTKATAGPYSSSPRDRQLPPSPRLQTVRPQAGTSPRNIQPSQQRRPSIGQQRPTPIHAATAPVFETAPTSRQSPRIPTESNRRHSRQFSKDETSKQAIASPADLEQEAIAEAEQAVRDAREYVLVEKKAVEINAMADAIDYAGRTSNPRSPSGQSLSPRGQISRRATTQVPPASTTGAVPSSPSRAVQISQGRSRQDSAPQRQNSYGQSYGSSPSTTSAIAKALHGASVRMFGVGWSPALIGKGPSPPQLFSALPNYSTAPGAVGLISNLRSTGPLDEDQKTINIIEESASISDVVYGFAEVKYKQLIPLAPSMDHGLGGPAPEIAGGAVDEDEGLTPEAIVALSEEALVLYVKALSLLAKSMDIAGSWWTRRNRGEILSGGNTPKSESPSSIAAGTRINGAVQWVRGRFNEVLEKADFVRLKLVEAQKLLPEDHPGHPSNHTSASRLAGASSTDGVFLSSGITAERLMYDRALEMSRSAAINEIANEDLIGCERSYVTAIRMLEAVLENDEEIPPQRQRASSLSHESKPDDDDSVNGIRVDDRKDILKGRLLPGHFTGFCLSNVHLSTSLKQANIKLVLSMIKTRLSTLRKKMAIIAKHQSIPPASPRPGSLRSGGTTPTLGHTPPTH